MPSDFELERAVEDVLQRNPDKFTRLIEPAASNEEEVPWPKNEHPALAETGRQDKGDLKGFPLELVISAPELSALDIPEREEAIPGVMYTRSLVMIFGRRGRGKTRLGMSLANAFASGGKFLAWQIEQSRRTLFVDGELPAIDLKHVVLDTCGTQTPENLDLISSEFFFAQEDFPLNLNNEVHQKRLLLLLAELERVGRKPEIIFLDNLSALTAGLEENSNSEQDSFLRYLLRLRHLGFSVIFMHHTGRNGDQRGATRREDFLDLSWKLSDPPEGQSCNARFILEFSKIRRKLPSPSRIDCTLITGPDGRLVWKFDSVEQEIEKWIQCLRSCQTMKPGNQKEIGESLRIPKASVSRYLADSREKGYLDDLKVTSKGAAFLAKIYGEN